MKHLVFIICLLLAPLLRADIIQINRDGGIAIYDKTVPSLFGSGLSLEGGAFTFSAFGTPPSWLPGRFFTGSLTATLGDFLLQGQLSHIFFNLKTGLLMASFRGQMRKGGDPVLHFNHATFYEKVNLKDGTLGGGFISYSTAPEPETLGLFSAGIGIILFAYRRIAGTPASR